ncbi:MAG: outer membrane lipoprotein-sorting protein [SAR324 cluster bacterium]|nr:outer membrane lipoprotein-sorting protein [SAR324 cluster bacterium]
MFQPDAQILMAAELTARQIMEQVDARNNGDNVTMNTRMVLIDKKGEQRVHEILSYKKDKGQDHMALMMFVDPPGVKDVGFLTYDYEDQGKEDDQWLYMPAVHKTNRIAGGDKSSSFMGSDFNYSDMSSVDVDDYDYELMENTEVNGVPVWQIRSTPKTQDVIDKTGYTKSILFVRKDNFVVIRSALWVHKRSQIKYMEVKNLELIDKIWVATEIHMTTKKGQDLLHKTILSQSNVKFDQNLSDDLFTLRRLEKGT